MIDIKIDTADCNIIFENGILQTVTGLDAIRQGLTTKLRHFKGEYFLDRFYGVDFFNIVFNKLVSIDSVNGHIKRMILDYPGVLSISDYTSTTNSSSRVFSVSCNVVCNNGIINFTAEL